MAGVEGKVAIVTGAGTGIGRATAIMLGAGGATIVGCSRTQANLDETQKLIEQAGGQGMTVSADLGTEAGVNKLVDATMAEYGRIDVVVNCAGVGYSYEKKQKGSMADTATVTRENWRTVMDIDFESCVMMGQRVIPIMQKQGSGNIVNVASILGLVGIPDAHAYTAAKGAMVNLTRSWAVTYARDGLRCNCLCPGYIDTPMIESHMDIFESEDTATALCPMGRAGRPEEIAFGIKFLVSDENGFANGTILVLDGGTTASP